MSQVHRKSLPPVPAVSDFKTLEQLASELNCSVATIYRRLAAREVALVRVLGRRVVRVEDAWRLADDAQIPTT